MNNEAFNKCMIHFMKVMAKQAEGYKEGLHVSKHEELDQRLLDFFDYGTKDLVESVAEAEALYLEGVSPHKILLRFSRARTLFHLLRQGAQARGAVDEENPKEQFIGNILSEFCNNTPLLT